MNPETLKDALIYALNFGLADRLLESVCRVIDGAECPGELMKDLAMALVLLRVDTVQIIRLHERNQKALADYYRESAQQALEEKIGEAQESRRFRGTHVEDPALEREAA